jgi:D-alanine-D-alanine ligase
VNTSIDDLHGIVLIADRTYNNYNEIDVGGDDLEMISNNYFNDIWTSLLQISHKLTHYNSPKELIEHAGEHQGDLVLTVYGGRASRNRMALVPAICEGAGIRFVGADAYARIICQDKFLSKTFAARFNIDSPRGILIETPIQERLISELRFPLVVKPNFEGSSIGITESSKVFTIQEALNEISRQQQQLNQPILVEEFISGPEVCICIVGSSDNIQTFEVMEIICEEDESFLYDRLYTAKNKHLSDINTSHRSITSQLNSDQKESILAMYKSLGKMDFMRVDGRVNKGSFTLIELTPDGYLGSDSSFGDAYREKGLSHKDLLSNIIRNALDYYQTPYSNYIKS